ncbi:MAG: hypothetical protein WB709_02615 [Solirubrobacteraceae bacterium]
MSDSPSGDLHETASTDGPGILAGLPRTRPQRTSARRVASRTATSSAAGTASPRQASATSSRPISKRAPASKRTTGKRTTGKRRTTAKTSAPTKSIAAVEERAPRQGFEAEADSLGAVQPPGSTELISSAAELAGELAKAGVSTGARVLRDFLSRLPG